MSSWLNADIDFGVPFTTYSIPMRSILGGRVYEDWKEAEKEGPDEVAKVLADYIVSRRPTLKGLSVLWFSIKSPSMLLEVTVCHPDLPRISSGLMSEATALEPCGVCKKDISTGEKLWAKWVDDDPNATQGYQVLCCSQECVER